MTMLTPQQELEREREYQRWVRHRLPLCKTFAEIDQLAEEFNKRYPMPTNTQER